MKPNPTFLNSEYKNSKGNSLLELLVVLFIAGIGLNGMMSNLIELNRPLYNAGAELSHTLRLARSKAISQTTFVTLKPTSAFRIQGYNSTSCSGALTAIDGFFLDLPSGSQLKTTSWTTCFTPRGLAFEETKFIVKDENNVEKSIHIALGGGAQIE